MMGILILLPACASAPPPAPPPVEIAPALPVTATATATAAPAPPPSGRVFVREQKTLPEDIDDDTGPSPCDFNRTYRGRIAENTRFTVLVRPGKGGNLEGLIHYDKPGPPIVLTGARRGSNEFTLSEKGGGRFEGICGEGGKLEGTYALGKRNQPFELRPRPADWPPIHKASVEITAEPHHPLCAVNAKPEVPIEIEDDGRTVVCLPTNPKRKKDLLESAPNLLCSLSDRGYRLFGLADTALEKRVNQILAPTWMEAYRKDLARCSGPMHEGRSAGLIALRPDLLVMSQFHSAYYGGAHPMSSAGGSTAVDLVQGATVSLDDILDPTRLRDLASACLPFHEQVRQRTEPRVSLEEPLVPTVCGKEKGMERHLWGCDKDDVQSPTWALRPEGIVVGAWGNPHVSAVDDGKGPVIPWSVLQREKMLKPGSKVARLWAGVKPAGDKDVACPVVYHGDKVVTWREAPP